MWKSIPTYRRWHQRILLICYPPNYLFPLNCQHPCPPFPSTWYFISSSVIILLNWDELFHPKLYPWKPFLFFHSSINVGCDFHVESNKKQAWFVMITNIPGIHLSEFGEIVFHQQEKYSNETLSFFSLTKVRCAHLVCWKARIHINHRLLWAFPSVLIRLPGGIICSWQWLYYYWYQFILPSYRQMVAWSCKYFP